MFDARSNTPMFGSVRPKRVNAMRFTFRRPFFIVPLALLFLFNALGGDMLIGEVWAAESSSGLTSVGPDSTGSPSPLKVLSAATFTLPQEFGYIQESAEVPGSGKTVIHIQDAHCNYAAQKSIAEILDYLTTEYGIYAVNCEGAAESYDLSPFTVIPEKDIREKTADFFVKEGVVSAAEYYAVNNPEKVNLWGVEDPDLYLKNLKIYRDSLSHKDEVDRYIKSIGYILDNLKRHIYSDELLELDKYYTGYKEGKIAFKEYILYLISMAHKRMIDIKSFSNMYLLSQTLAEEDKINFKRANNEKDEIVDTLKKSLSRNELEELMVMVGKLKTERISQADFYAYLVKKAKSVKLDISVYDELQKYIIYISLYGAIDRTKVTKEIDTLEDRIKTSLYENDSQRELGVLSKNLAITKNMFNISLTRDDYIYYKEHRETFAVANYISFIDKKAPLYKISAVLDKNIGALDVYREKMEGFYECSLERDKAFIKNIKFTDHDRPNSIIITGGFHTENLRELFKDEKVSYISIMPKFKNPPGYESPYMKRLAGQSTALENVINTAIPAVLNLAAVEILSLRLANLVMGRRDLNITYLAIQVLAQVNRGRQFVLKIDRGAYPKDEQPDKDKIITYGRAEGADVPFKEVAAPLGQVKPNATITANGIKFTTEQAQATKPDTIYEPPIIEPVAIVDQDADKARAMFPTFIATLLDADGKLVNMSGNSGLVIRKATDGKSILVEPPGMQGINVIISKDQSLRSSLRPALRRLLKNVKDKVRDYERKQIYGILDKLRDSSVVVLDPGQKVQELFFGNTFYISSELINAPLSLIRPEAIRANVVFAQNLERITGNLRKGIFNIFLMKTTPETIAGQTTVGRETINKFEKKFGLNTAILYYTDLPGQQAQLKRMAELLSLEENKGKYPMAYADCMNKEEFAEVSAFKERNPDIRDMIALNKDYTEDEAEKKIPEEVKVMIVGSIIMNDRRLRMNFNINAEDLLESRHELLNFLVGNRVIDTSEFKNAGVDVTTVDAVSSEEAEKIMDAIWQGSIRVQCTKINWKSFDDWKNSQRQLLQSV
jgi:hypothetical protein